MHKTGYVPGISAYSQRRNVEGFLKWSFVVDAAGPNDSMHLSGTSLLLGFPTNQCWPGFALGSRCWASHFHTWTQLWFIRPSNYSQHIIEDNNKNNEASLAEQRTHHYKTIKMLPSHLTTLLQSSFVEIVTDNAKSHVSKDQGAPKRRNSAPVSSSPTKRNRRGSLKRARSDTATPASRWESECIKDKDCPTPMMGRCPMEGSSLRSVLSKPVRRQSIDDPRILAMLHDSLSSFEGFVENSSSTSAILAKALETLDLYDDEFWSNFLDLHKTYHHISTVNHPRLLTAGATIITINYRLFAWCMLVSSSIALLPIQLSKQHYRVVPSSRGWYWMCRKRDQAIQRKSVLFLSWLLIRRFVLVALSLLGSGRSSTLRSWHSMCPRLLLTVSHCESGTWSSHINHGFALCSHNY